VIIAAITSCTNTSNPRNVIAAGLLAKKANALGLVRKPWVKSSLAPGSKTVALYLEEAGLKHELEKLGFGIVAFACTTCNGMSGALDPKIQQEIIDRDLSAPVGEGMPGAGVPTLDNPEAGAALRREMGPPRAQKAPIDLEANPEMGPQTDPDLDELAAFGKE